MLTPCAECSRHVRATESLCPFCGGELTAPAKKVGSWMRGTTRAAIFYFGASLAACGAGEAPETETIVQPYGAPPDPPPDDQLPIAQPYGAPPEPPADEAPEPPPERPPEDEEPVAPPYGAPPPPPPEDPEPVAPPYGAPPPPPEEDMPVAQPYGAPPQPPPEIPRPADPAPEE